MRLYVCYTTRGGDRHACGRAHDALRERGWQPEVQHVLGFGALPAFMNPTRREVMRISGQHRVPVLVTDDEEIVVGSQQIADWARANPAVGADKATA